MIGSMVRTSLSLEQRLSTRKTQNLLQCVDVLESSNLETQFEISLNRGLNCII